MCTMLIFLLFCTVKSIRLGLNPEPLLLWIFVIAIPTSFFFRFAIERNRNGKKIPPSNQPRSLTSVTIPVSKRCILISENHLPSFISGQAYQEGRSYRQVRHPLWRFPEEDRQEDGGLSTLQVHLYLLRQGEHEAQGCRCLAMRHQELQSDRRRRCMDLCHHQRSHRQISHQTSEGTKGTVNREPHAYSSSHLPAEW